MRGVLFRGPGVSLRSTPGYCLSTRRVGGNGQPKGLPDSSRRSKPGADLRCVIPKPHAPRRGARQLTRLRMDRTQLLQHFDTLPETPDPGYRSIQPPATIFQPVESGATDNPKGCQTVAGGRSQAETSGARSPNPMHPGGVPDKKRMPLATWRMPTCQRLIPKIRLSVCQWVADGRRNEDDGTRGETHGGDARATTTAAALAEYGTSFALCKDLADYTALKNCGG